MYIYLQLIHYILMYCIKTIYKYNTINTAYLIYCINYWIQTISLHFKALLITYLIILIQTLKMASSKPKHITVIFNRLYMKVVLHQNFTSINLWQKHNGDVSPKHYNNATIEQSAVHVARLRKAIPPPSPWRNHQDLAVRSALTTWILQPPIFGILPSLYS